MSKWEKLSLKEQYVGPESNYKETRNIGEHVLIKGIIDSAVSDERHGDATEYGIKYVVIPGGDYQGKDILNTFRINDDSPCIMFNKPLEINEIEIATKLLMELVIIGITRKESIRHGDDDTIVSLGYVSDSQDVRKLCDISLTDLLYVTNVARSGRLSKYETMEPTR